MSNFSRQTINPDTGKTEKANWLDDHFGKHCYGIQFPSSGKIFRESDIKLAEEEVIRRHLDLATLDWIKQRWGGFSYLLLARNENFRLNFCNDQLTLHAESDDINSPAWEILLLHKPTKSQVADAEGIFGVEIDLS